MGKLAAISTAAVLVGTVATATAALAVSHSRFGSAPVVLRGASGSVPVTPDSFNGDLRALPKAKAPKPGDPIYEVPKRVYPRPPKAPSVPPPAAPKPNLLPEPPGSEPGERGTRALTTPIVNVEGISFTNVAPPDTVGDVGPNHYIQMVNSFDGADFVIADKSGTILAGPLTLDTLIPTGNCANGLGDPIVLYDSMADRWLMSEFAEFGNSLCVYVSQTPDPVSGGWFRYEFPTPYFPDFPKYSVWPDAYYVTTNEVSPAIYALDRTNMLAGSPATSQRFPGPSLSKFIFQAFTPADLDGANTPPSGSPGYFVRHRDDEAHDEFPNPTADFLEVWELRVDFATPANSTFTGPLDVPVSEFDSDLCGLVVAACFPQPTTTMTLDPVREVVMWRLQYRNFGSHESLVGNFVTDVDGTDHGGIRWFELRKTGAGAWSLFQEGTYAPDADHRWLGSIAMDGNGNIALGYSVSSPSVFPSMRYTGRLGSDTAGLMTQPETTIIAGTGAQTFISRWGDYSAMSVDPVDDCTFVHTNEYVPGGGFWQTRVASFKFASCDNTPAYWCDFNANKRSDILWRNSATQKAVVWLMNGYLKEDGGEVGAPSADWMVAGLGDFDGDSAGDILWRNTATGNTVIWLMNGLLKADSGSIAVLDLDWQIVGVGDFNGDRRSDILWRNTVSNNTVIWLMDGLVRSDSSPVGNLGAVWEVVGVGDLNKDTKADILWRNSTTGTPAAWLMNGFVKEATGSIGSPLAGWNLQRLGDFNGDRRSDILWRNSTTGAVVMWLMNGLAKDTAGSIGNPGPDWQIRGAGDHDGDGMSDILWRNTSTGNAVIWKMNGLSKLDTGSIGSPATDWVVQ